MAATDIFQDLKDVLQEFKDFLDANVAIIKPAMKALASLMPQVVELINVLAKLLDQIKTEVQDLEVSSIPGLAGVSEFTGKISGLVEVAEPLLPDDLDHEVDQVLEVAAVVSSLPSLDAIRHEIIALIDAVTAHLNSLSP